MAESEEGVVKRNYWILGVVLVSLLAACSSEFRTCYETRTCAPQGGSKGDAGSAGEAGTDGGEGGSAGGESAMAAGSAGETNGEGGAAGAVHIESGAAGNEESSGGADGHGEPCGSGFAMCIAGCISTDSDAENCGGCNLKCPRGSVCKTGMCEVRVGYPNRFTGNDDNAFHASADTINAVPIVVTKRSTLVALGFLNASTAASVATFGLYNDSGTETPGALVASVTDVALQGSVNEIKTNSVILAPGTYYFAILPRDDNEPTIFTSLSASPKIDIWYSGSSYKSGLPPTFGSVGSEVFAGHAINVYLVARQAGS